MQHGSSSLQEQAQPSRKRIGIDKTERIGGEKGGPSGEKKTRMPKYPNVNGTRGRASAYGSRSLSYEWIHSAQLARREVDLCARAN